MRGPQRAAWWALLGGAVLVCLLGQLLRGPIGRKTRVEPPTVSHDSSEGALEGLTSPGETLLRAQVASLDTQGPLALPARMHVEVRWSDDNQPASGIPLRLLRPPFPSDAPPEHSGHTDSLGVWTLDTLAPGQAAVAGVQETRSLKLISGETSKVLMRQARGVSVRGTVVDGHDNPIQGAEVWISPPVTRGEWLVAFTDANGAFDLRGVPINSSVWARSSGWAGVHAVEITPAFVSEGLARVDLRLSVRAAIIQGHVLDADALPAKQARVLAGHSQFRSTYDATSGTDQLEIPGAEGSTLDDGSFVIAGVRPGLTRVVVHEERHSVWIGSAVAGDPDAGPMTIRLSRGATVEGVVRDSQGASFPQALIGIGRFGTDTYKAVRSAADGSYRLANIPAGEVEIRASCKTAPPLTTLLSLRDGESFRWDPSFKTGNVVVGRLEIGSAAPDSQFVVNLTAGMWRTAAKVDGLRFEARGVPAGSVQITVKEVGGSDLYPAAQIDVDVPVVGELVIPVQCYRNDCNLRLRATDSAGQPLSGARVAVVHEAMNVGQVSWTDATGVARVESLVPGSYSVEVLARGCRSVSQRAIEVRSAELCDLGDVICPAALTVLLRRVAMPTLELLAFEFVDRDASVLASGEVRVDRPLEVAVPAGADLLQVSGGQAACFGYPVHRLGSEVLLHGSVGVPVHFETSLGGVSPLSFQLDSEAGIVRRWREDASAVSARVTELHLSPGTYRLVVTASGRAPWRTEFSVSDLGAEPLRVAIP